MQWEYTETLTKKDLIQILKGMAESLEKKGILEAWIGNTKINVEVGDIFILETVYDQNPDKKEVNFSLNLSWIVEKEIGEKTSKFKKPSRKREVKTQEIVKEQVKKPKKISPDTIPLPEVKPSTQPEEIATPKGKIEEIPSPSLEIQKEEPSIEISTPKQQIPLSPKADIISDEIPVPPTNAEVKRERRKEVEKEFANIGLPTPQIPEPSEQKTEKLSEEQVIITTSEGNVEYVSAFNWTITTEWKDVSIQQDNNFSQQSIPSKSQEENEDDIFKELDEDESLVRPSDFLKKKKR